MELKKVFEPGKIGSLAIPNRLVVSAMSSHLGNPDGTPNEEVTCYLEAKARGGWGLIFTEDLGVTEDAGSDPIVGSLWSDSQVPAWTETVRRVHAAGGLMGAQLYYREHAQYAKAAREGTEPLQPPALVTHLLSSCASVREAVADKLPDDVEVALIKGGQPVYYFIISVE